MGFCRRCGDIVVGPRCKCGGATVAGVVQWSNGKAQLRSKDNVSPASPMRKSSPKSIKAAIGQLNGTVPESHTSNRPSAQSTTVGRRFPRPLETSRISDARLSSTSSSTTQRSPSATKQRIVPADLASTHSDAYLDDAISSPHAGTLAKAYGSVLQPEQTLATYSCFKCHEGFPPDATVYPDPKAEAQFLCHPCFVSNGGSKGACAGCDKPVLILRSEGGFVESQGRVWHKRCFRCESCFKDISNSPAVNLEGRPCCTTCFESSSAPRSSHRRQSDVPSEKRSNIGGLRMGSRESSPVLDELEVKLRIRSREGSPLRESRLSAGYTDQTPPRPPSRTVHRRTLPQDVRDMTALHLFPHPSSAESPLLDSARRSSARQSSLVASSPSASHKDAIEDWVGHATRQSPDDYSGALSPSTSRSSSALRELLPNTPDLLSDYSDSLAHSRGLSTSGSSSPSMRNSKDSENIHLEGARTLTKSKVIPPILILSNSPRSLCASCSEPLPDAKAGGSFVTVPDNSGKLRKYHIGCFRCTVCTQSFSSGRDGRASFVESDSGVAHVECAPSERSITCSSPVATSPRQMKKFSDVSSTTILTFPRFGSSTSCPGCHQAVSPMERGVVPGPQGSRWHSSCLICGGKDYSRATVGRRDPDNPGCGKKLDSAAKFDGEGGVWCSKCLLLLQESPQSSPIRLTAPCIFPKTPNRVTPQSTGTTSRARQFVGSTNGVDPLVRQLTGGGLSPTRQLMSGSPTKQLGMRPLSGNFGASALSSARIRPRPKSVLGLGTVEESSREGRGMFLVRQMTGTRPA